MYRDKIPIIIILKTKLLKLEKSGSYEMGIPYSIIADSQVIYPTTFGK